MKNERVKGERHGSVFILLTVPADSVFRVVPHIVH